MRRWMLTLVVISALVSMVGCHCNCMHSHGVCDCEQDEYCSSRSPWIRYAGPGHSDIHLTGNGDGMPIESIPAPLSKNGL